MALQRVQAATILHQVVVVGGEASSTLGVLPNFCSSHCTTCFVLLIMTRDPQFHVFPLRAPHCAFCAFRCGLLFELWSFCFFCCSLAMCFSFIYLFQFTTKLKGFCQCCSGIKFIRYQASTVILVFSELSPVWSWYGVHNWFLASMQQVYTWYWDLY